MYDQKVSLNWIRRHGAGAVAGGASERQLFALSLIDLDRIDERDDAEIHPAQYFLFWLNAALGTEDASHGLARQRLKLGSSALSVRIMLGSATLGSAIEAVRRFYHAASSSVTIKLEAAENYASVCVHHDGRTESASLVMEDTALSWLFMCCSCFLGRPLPVIDVTTRDPSHFNLGRRHWAIKAPLSLDTVPAFRFPKSLLGARRGGHSSDDALWQCTRSWLRFVEDFDTREMAFSGRNRDLLDGIGGPPLARQKMTMRQGSSSREGGYRQERQRQLADAGVFLLKSSAASVDAVAARLGYADARSFRRFLKNATGMTPYEVRNSAHNLREAQPSEIYARIKEAAARLE